MPIEMCRRPERRAITAPLVLAVLDAASARPAGPPARRRAAARPAPVGHHRGRPRRVFCAGEVSEDGARDFYLEVVLPALADRLDQAFPEFGWRRDRDGWVATNEEHTHICLGVRAERVVAHGPAPQGFLVHGGDATLWTAYVNGRRFIETCSPGWPGAKRWRVWLNVPLPKASTLVGPTSKTSARPRSCSKPPSPTS